MIAVANGTDENPASSMVHCYRVSVKKQMDSLTLTSQSLPSFFLTGGAARDIPGTVALHSRIEQKHIIVMNVFRFRHFGDILEMDIQ